MFPRDFFIDYWKPDLRNQLFVAMPFASIFDRTFHSAIAPAAKSCGLEPFRVDMRKASDSILVDILDGVAHARLVLVDLSPVSCDPPKRLRTLLTGAARRPKYPNGNVMYELGLAHATRQAEEVILVRRQPQATLLFDVSSVRVHTYQADDLGAARATFHDLLVDAMATIDRTKALQVAKAVQAIAVDDVWLIRKFFPDRYTLSPKKPDDELRGFPGRLTAATSHLQQLGVIRSMPSARPDGFAVVLEWTDFGRAVVAALPPALLQGSPVPPRPEAREAAVADPPHTPAGTRPEEA